MVYPLIRQLTAKRLLLHTPKIIYSGLLEEILQSSIDNQDRKALIQRIKTLVNNNIKGYYDRESYENEILRFLAGNEESLDLIIEEELKKNPSFIFKNNFGSDSFKGKSFESVAKKLEEYDHLRNDFKKEIIQQVIAYLTEIV